MRLDSFLREKYGWSRNKAQQIIESGLVFIDDMIATKQSQEVDETCKISIQEDRRVEWVSRSAEKLEWFFEICQDTIAFQWAYCLDIGSSTGWFTQVLLGHEVTHVDAVEVGTNQLHPYLRNSAKVSLFEKTDIRDFVKNTKLYDIIVCDVSFISLHEILPSIMTVSWKKTQIFLLYKPQFEVEKKNLTKNGVPKNLKQVYEKMETFEKVVRELGFVIIQKEKSILLGESGNQEWVYFIKKG